MPAGRVKWFDPAKGYGFIERDDGAKDVFVYAQAIEQSGIGVLQEGQDVRFETEPGRDDRLLTGSLSVT